MRNRLLAGILGLSFLTTPVSLLLDTGIAHADIVRAVTRAPWAACTGDTVTWVTTVILTDPTAPNRGVNWELDFGDGHTTSINRWNYPKYDMSVQHIYTSPGVYQWEMEIDDPMSITPPLDFSSQIGAIAISDCNPGGTSAIGVIGKLSIYRDDTDSRGAILNVTVKRNPNYYVLYHINWGDGGNQQYGNDDWVWVPPGPNDWYNFASPIHVYDYYGNNEVGHYEHWWAPYVERYPSGDSSYSGIWSPSTGFVPHGPYKYTGAAEGYQQVPAVYVYHIC